MTADGDQNGGVTANGQGTGIVLAQNAQANVNGSNDSVALNAGVSLGIYGGGNTIGAQAGDLVVIGGTGGAFDTVFASGDAAGGTTANGQATGVMVNANAQVNVRGNGNAVLNQGGGSSVGVYGGANLVTALAGDLIVLGNTGGAADTVAADNDATGGTTANGQGTGLFLNSSTQANIAASGSTVWAFDSVTASVTGTGNTVLASGTAASLTLSGGSDTVSALAGNTLALTNGGGYSVSGSNLTVSIGAYTNGTITGTNNGITATGTNTNFSLSGGSDTIALQSDSNVNLANGGGYSVTGSASTVNIGAYTNGLIWGNGLTVTASGGQTNFTVAGDSDTLNLWGQSNVNLAGGGGFVINASTITVNAASYVNATLNGTGNTLTDGGTNASFSLNGGASTVNLAAGDYVHLANGGGYVVNASGSGVGLGGYVNATVNGSNDEINDDAGNTSLTVVGSANTINAGVQNFTSVVGDSNTVTAAAGAVSLAGSHDTADISLGLVAVADNSSAQVNGTGNTVQAGTSDIVGIAGDSNYLQFQTGGAALFSGTGNAANVNGTALYQLDGSPLVTAGSIANAADFRAQMAQSATVINAIDELYNEVLARDADAGGMANAQAFYAAGGSLGDLRANLANSPELAADMLGTYAAIGAAPPTVSETGAFAEIMSASYDTPITVMNRDGVVASTTAGNILSELPVLETISDGRTLSLSMPDGSTMAFNDTARLADFLFAVAAQKSQATAFTQDVLNRDVAWLDQVDQPMLDLANRETDLAAYNDSVGKGDQAALARLAATVAMQIAAMPATQRTTVTAKTQSQGHEVDVTVYANSGEANGPPVRFHNVDPGILGILEQVGVVLINAAAIAFPETGVLVVAAAAVDAAEAGKAFANGQVIQGILDLAAAAGGAAGGVGAVDVGKYIAIASEALGGVYGVEQGIEHGDVLGTIVGVLEVAAAGASGIGQIDPDIKDLTSRIAQGLNIVATATSLTDQFIKGNVANGLVASLGVILDNIAADYAGRQAELAQQAIVSNISPAVIGVPKHMVFVGGFFDDTFTTSPDSQTMEGASQRFAKLNPGSDVQYFTHDQGDVLASYIKSVGGDVTILSHSWGADTAAAVVADLPAGLKVSSLITLDPVGYAHPDFAQVAAPFGNMVRLQCRQCSLELAKRDCGYRNGLRAKPTRFCDGIRER